MQNAEIYGVRHHGRVSLGLDGSVHAHTGDLWRGFHGRDRAALRHCGAAVRRHAARARLKAVSHSAQRDLVFYRHRHLQPAVFHVLLFSGHHDHGSVHGGRAAVYRTVDRHGAVTAFVSPDQNGNEILTVRVKNNGSYFEDNILQKLQNGERQPHGFGIGLLNVLNRLQITYGDPFGLQVYNEYDEYDTYAIAEIRIPAVSFV